MKIYYETLSEALDACETQLKLERAKPKPGHEDWRNRCTGLDTWANANQQFSTPL
jgi:hypothetical protein